MKTFTKFFPKMHNFAQRNLSLEVLTIRPLRYFLKIIVPTLLFFITIGVAAQNVGDFQSANTGNWTTVATWQTWDGDSWEPALVYPGQNATTAAVTIQSGHTVTVHFNEFPNVIGSLYINGELYLAGDNSGGNFYVNSMNITVGNTGLINFDKKGTLNLPTNAVITFLSGGNFSGTCTNNNLVYLGGNPYAICTGGGGNYFLFSQLVAAGSTINAIPTLSSPPFISCQSFPLYGNYSGAIGSSVVYSWSVKNPLNETTVYPNQDITIENALPGLYLATLTVSTVYGGNTYTNSETINITVEHYTSWTGAVDTDWASLGNWSCGEPTFETNTTIPLTDNKPVVTAVALTKNLTIDDGAQVTIDPAAILFVVENISNNAGVSGIFVNSDNTGVLPSGSLIFHNDITVIPVPATVRFYSKAFIDPDAKWQYFGIPFIEYVPGWTLGAYKKYSWDETFANNTHWQIVQPVDVMYPFMGYAITQENADWYDIKGNLYNLPIVNYPLSYTTANGNDYAGMHILGNPYTAAIRISDISFYKMEQSVGFYNTGSYNDWLTNSGSSTTGENPGQYLNVPQNQAGQNGLPASIPSMQGFLVKVDPTQFLVKRFSDGMQRVSAIGGSISIPYIPFQNAEPLRAKKDVQPVVSTIIDIRGENFGDRMWLFTNTNCTKDFDNGWDSRKIMGSNSAPQLFFVENDNKFQVSTVDDVNGSFLGFRKGIDNEYTMTFTHNNAELAYPNGIYLMDLVANKTVDVTENGSTYNFTVNGSSLAKASKVPAETEVVRFKIVTSPGITTDKNSIKNEIKVIVSEKSIIFDNQTEKQAQMTLFDVTGKVVMSSNVNAGVSSVNVNVPAGTYIVQVVADRTNIKSSIIIK